MSSAKKKTKISEVNFFCKVFKNFKTLLSSKKGTFEVKESFQMHASTKQVLSAGDCT